MDEESDFLTMASSWKRFLFSVITQVLLLSHITPVQHSRTKHLDIRYHFIREHVMNCIVELHFVPSEKQLADIFTKPVDESTFSRLVSELGILNYF